jgi:flagellar biosynthesis/type III secretory pathway protein FliH
MSEAEQYHYERSLDRVRIAYAERQAAEQEGMEKGIAAGRAEGIEEGKQAAESKLPENSFNSKCRCKQLYK